MSLVLILMTGLFFAPQSHASYPCEKGFRIIYRTDRSSDFHQPESFFRGPIEKRLAWFVQRHPNVIQVVPEVEMGFHHAHRLGPKDKERAHTQDSKVRTLLIISSASISESKEQEVIADFNRAFADDFISFPLPEFGRHLRMRLGEKMVDLDIALATKTRTVLDGRDRIEPMVFLEPDEMNRMHQYVTNIRESVPTVLGKFKVTGMLSGKTTGNIDNNHPTGKNQCHNCVTWLSSAPVGDNGASLASMVNLQLGKDPVKGDVARVPGVWVDYLMGSAPTKRVPFVVLWTQAPLAKKVKEVSTEGRLRWVHYNELEKEHHWEVQPLD